MRDRFTVTISDDHGSHYYSVRKGYRQVFIFGVALFLVIFCGSVSVNYLQYKHARWLGKINRSIDDQLVELNANNARLNQSVNMWRQQIENISDELVEIEKISGVESSHNDTSLQQRLKLLAEFYGEKEQQYAEVSKRVQQTGGISVIAESEPGIAETLPVELASLTVNHERILHDSIPNGYPTKSTIVNGAFGKRSDPVTGIKIFHKGVDLEVTKGEVVTATADGIVREADFLPLTGNRVMVQHNFGFETRYSHLKQIDLIPGDVVHKGDKIGLAGVGHGDKNSLHYEIRYLGKSIDPEQFLKWQFGSHEIFTKVKGIKWPSLISLINKQLPQNFELSGM